MPTLPSRYRYLEQLTPPLMVAEALKEFGTLEGQGGADNPKILRWANEVGAALDTNYARWVADFYNKDSIPWCGLFMAVVTMRANKQKRPERNPPNNFLSALAWAAFGRQQNPAGLGDVLVFVRQGGGHVGLYVGEDATAFHVLGGNQSDSVNIARISKSRLYAVRRPVYQQQPASVKAYRLSGDGAISTNEA
jgi:uncharacterized protein (TIGR02594 family)